MYRRTGLMAKLTFATIILAGLFMPKASSASNLPFDDIDDSYAKQAIIDLYNKKIITGTSSTSFSPTRSMTRAEFIAVLNRLLKLEQVFSPVSPYADVPKSAWYYGWIQAAVQLELVSGTSATTFAPNKQITRQEAAVLLTNALKLSGNTNGSGVSFKDIDDIAEWALDSVAEVNKLKLMVGDDHSRFRPSDPIKRQEAAILLSRVLKQDGWEAELNAAPDDRIVMGWQYGQTVDEYTSTIKKSNVNTLSPRWYFVGNTGEVTDVTDSSLVTWAKKNNKKVWAMVGNRSNQEATHELLSSATARNNAVNQLAAKAKQYGVDGLNLDFENVAPADRAYFTAFVTELAAKLHAMNKTLSVDVSPDLGTDWTEAFDYAKLGKQADYIVLMGYDEHYGGSLYPGPNASLPYVRSAINTLMKAVDPAKIILALPFYNRDWTLNPNGTAASSSYLTFTEQNGLIEKLSLRPVWDAELGQYVAGYTKQSLVHSIWIEDGRSLIAKYKLVATKGLAGIAYWHIGGESPDIWPSMRNAERYYDYRFETGNS
ncbi:S-layer homology domain-containing protein [Paenibacillus sp. LHD-117]|uniref:S-layer homology domain-containing protein n=1 Tax=Paenibacillus sp. LHD-117 TaxID=3071412 RepID=UPI0027E07871|nr:S-layer homology domain-containing protein [Paenibacillus sp. LHD-117]MDQ6423221.1 S-layer homology domain-containing protein [Paenibacillus sp. LHD-117]